MSDSIATRWVRTSGGRTIHSNGCHILARPNLNAAPWKWAEGFETQYALLEALEGATGPTWNRFCAFCCAGAHWQQIQAETT